MKQFFKIFILLLVISSCEEKKSSIIVSSNSELEEALSNAKKGDNIVLKNGTYKDINIKFIGEGTENEPITLSAETAGEVFIEGESSLELSGNYLQVRGLFFRNGHSPKKNVIAFRTSPKDVANHSPVTNCVILDFNNLERDQDPISVDFLLLL